MRLWCNKSQPQSWAKPAVTQREKTCLYWAACTRTTESWLEYRADVCRFLWRAAFYFRLQQQQESVAKHCVNAEPHHGALWCAVSKNIDNWRHKTTALLPMVAASVAVPSWAVCHLLAMARTTHTNGAELAIAKTLFKQSPFWTHLWSVVPISALILITCSLLNV